VKRGLQNVGRRKVKKLTLVGAKKLSNCGEDLGEQGLKSGTLQRDGGKESLWVTVYGREVSRLTR